MKRSCLILIFGAVIALFSAGTGWADISKAEKNLERESKRLNDTAAKPDGEKAVLKELGSVFKVSDAQVRTLRDRKLGYGEIAIVLSLARKMPGGVTESNVEKVVAMRQGPPIAGWGKVAGQLGIKLGPTVSQVKKMNNDSNREIKKDHARSGKAVKKVPEAQPQEKAQERKEPGPPKTFEGEGKTLPHGRGAM